MQVIFTKRYMIALNVTLFFVNICLQEQFAVIVSALLIVFRESNIGTQAKCQRLAHLGSLSKK